MTTKGYFLGKAAVVTGAGSGIGRELTRCLLHQGCRLLAVDIDPKRLDALQAEACSVDLFCHTCDMSSPAEIDDLFERIRPTIGGCDIFFANAGFARHGTDLNIDWQDLEALFRLNVYSPMYCLSKLERSPEQEDHTFVVTASAMSHIPMPGYGVYGATKASIHNFCEAAQWQPERRVRIAVAYPITTRTDFFRVAGVDRMPWPSHTPETVARSMLKGLERGRRHLYPSTLVGIMIMLSRLCPAIERFLQYLEFRNMRQ